MEYRITFKNQFKALEFLIYGSIIFVVMLYIFYNKEGYGIDTNTLIYFLIYYFILLIPTIFLHVEYYLINKNQVVEINSLEKSIIFNEQAPLSFVDIEKIILVMSPVLYRKGSVRFTPFDDYNYAIIKIKGGEKFIFTCLMTYKLEETMDKIVGVPIEKRRRFIPTTLIT